MSAISGMNTAGIRYATVTVRVPAPPASSASAAAQAAVSTTSTLHSTVPGGSLASHQPPRPQRN